jgi:hypothetical protein
MNTARVSRFADWPGWIGLIGVAVVCLAPLVLEHKPVKFVSPKAPLVRAPAGKAIVIAVMALAVGARYWLDARQDSSHPWLAAGTLLLLATAMTADHWYIVDRNYQHREWQAYQYGSVLNGDLESQIGAYSTIPHVFRPLPYGFVRSIELLTGDWVFSFVAYRWFFNFWFAWGYYRFVRLFHGSVRSLAGVGLLLVYYPMSIWFYWGQLTDPISHALFALALVYVVQNRSSLLAAALTLGVLAKETAVVLVPGYYLCYWRHGVRAFAIATLLALCCAAAFLAVRLPLGWSLNLDEINATSGLMIGTNLGTGNRIFNQGAAPNYQNYLQPLLFVVPFLPGAAIYWRSADRRLRALFLTQVPLVLLSSLCFSWLYESRNYIPLLPILTSIALRPRKEAPSLSA